MSHKDIAIHFQRWAINVLFRAQLGTLEQKEELASDVLGVSASAIKAFLNTNVNSMPVVYMFTLGKVKDLRKKFDIHESYKDDEWVCKYGLSNDLKRRSQEHEKTYKKIDNVDLQLKFHVYIDPFYLSSAENDMEKYFKGAHWHLKNSKFTELACIPEHMMSSIVHNEFKRLGGAYAGKLQDLQAQLANALVLNASLQNSLDIQAQSHKDVIQNINYYNESLIKEKDDRLKTTEALFQDQIKLYKLIIDKQLLGK